MKLIRCHHHSLHLINKNSQEKCIIKNAKSNCNIHSLFLTIKYSKYLHTIHFFDDEYDLFYDKKLKIHLNKRIDRWLFKKG